MGLAGRPKKARNARAIQALKSGKRRALLDFGRRKGSGRIKGSKRKPEILKLHDLSRRTAPMPRIPTLQRTMDKVKPLGTRWHAWRFSNSSDARECKATDGHLLRSGSA
jgi:hypothetical protein